jgi:hypothetical protein
MKKKVNNQQVNNQQVNNNGCQHVQLGGMAFYDESKCFLFAPSEHGGGEKVQGFRSQGVAQQRSDGTFDFVVKPRIRSQSVLIRKLAHGRVDFCALYHGRSSAVPTQLIITYQASQYPLRGYPDKPDHYTHEP